MKPLATADKLRANMDAAECKHLVLGLIFVKYNSDTFAVRRAEVAARLVDPDDDYYYGEAAGEDLAAELEDRDYYREVNVFWVPEGARWEALRAAAKQPQIDKLIDDALTAIEAENPKLKHILDKRFARAQLLVQEGLVESGGTAYYVPKREGSLRSEDLSGPFRWIPPLAGEVS